MSEKTRKIVIGALDKAAGVMREPEHAAVLMRGQDLAFEDLDIDSLSVFEMLMFIEEALDLEIEVEDIEDIETVDAMAVYLDGRLEAA